MKMYWLLATVTILILSAASPVNAERFTCPKPMAIADRWDDLNSDTKYDVGESYDPMLTGFKVPEDLGLSLILNYASLLDPITAGHFFGINYPPLGGSEPPLTGGAWLREWFRACSPYIVSPEDSLRIELGSMVGPIIQTILDLIAQDPLAYWDETTGSVLDSEHTMSPRFIVIPLFDPTRPPDSSQNDLHVVKFLKVFVESVGPGSQINVRVLDVSSDPTPTMRVTWSFLKARY